MATQGIGRKIIMSVVLVVLGLLCIGSGLMIMRLQTGSSFYVVWYVLGALFFLAAGITYAGLWQAIPTLPKQIGLGVLAVFLAILVITQGMVLSAFSSKGEADLDCLIVLGAQVHHDGSPSVVLRHRLNAACDYLNNNPRTRCIVSGGQGPNETMPEAEGMANYLIAQGIDPSRITLETESRSTKENIEFSKKFFDPAHDRVGIVTNNFHVFRSVGIAKKAGVQHVCGIAAYTTPAYLPNNMFRETFGIIKEFVSGNL